MTDGFKKLEDKEVKDWKRREKLSEKEGIKPERVDKTEREADRKRGNYITDNIDETPNVQ